MFALRNLMSGFARDTRGSVAIIFGFSCIVLFGLVGVAMDTSRYYNYSSRMQEALDAAALAGAKLLPDDSVSDADIKQLVIANFNEAMNKTGVKASSQNAPVISIDRRKHTVEVDGVARLPAMLSTMLLPSRSVTINRTSKVIFDMKKVEMAMVLDITGSMNRNNKLRDMKTAANDIIDELYNGSLSEDGVRIGIAPYSASVNAGALAGDVVLPPPTTTATTTTTTTTSSTPAPDTCVVERQGPNAATDAAPAGTDKLPNVTTRPYGNYTCPSATVLPMQGRRNRDLVKDTINGYVASGATAGHIGTAWGWYLLSPEWSSVLGSSAPKPYNDPDVEKSMIVMTDGAFNTSYLTGGSTDPATQANESYAQFAALCSGAKAKGIKIFAVGFDLPDARALSELQACASDPENFFDARTGADLKKAFKAIAQKLNTLRVAS